MPQLSRRDFLKRTGAVVALAGAAGPVAAEDRAPRAELRTLTIPDLDPAHDGLKVVQLSDIHVGPRTPLERIRAAIDEANAFAPDLVVLTGDYLSGSRRGVGLMREQLGGLRAPTVAVLGNHDYWVDPRGAAGALEALGYAVLDNENTTIRLRGEPFTILGIGDLLTGNARPAEALQGARDGSRLVLAHGPKTADVLARLELPLLCLSGHTHGGQINIPGVTSIMLRAIAREPYDRGLFRVGRVQLYVNRGVGNSALRIRFNSPPEVTLLTLRSGLAA